jgi:hypothetical protein
MAKKILVNYTFEGNQIQNALVHVLATAPTALGAGQAYFDTTIGRLGIYDGTTWYYVYALNDAGTSTTDLWSADKIASEIAAAVSGGVNYQGGYDAATNTPNLDSSPTAGTILKGYMYTVTAAGTFYTEQVEIGDVLIAEVDDPATLADWTVVERNLNSATETSEGTTQIATQAEVDAGTDDFKYITPLKLATTLDNQNYPQKFAVDLDAAGEATVTSAFTGGRTIFTVTHSLNTTDTVVSVKEISTGEEVETEVDNTAANTVDIIFLGVVADDVYRVTVVG